MEALILVGIGFLISGIFHMVGVYGMTHDVETWSGQVTQATYQPTWLEYYEYAVYRTEYYTVTVSHTDSKGKSHTTTERRSRQVFDHWAPSTRNHGPEWSASDTLVGSYGVDQSRYEDVRVKFGGTVTPHRGCRTTGSHNSRMISGDPNDYSTVNTTNYIYPVTTVKSWENKVKASPSVFSYVKVPENMVPKLFEYPKNDNKFTSDRLVGAGSWGIVEWDQMNARLGDAKKVNVVAANFGTNADSNLATWLESYWIGGKKNDLVICFGGGDTVSKPKWCHTFGWSETEIVKRNIDTIVLENGVIAKALPLIEKEIQTNYVIKNWTKFDYLSVEIPMSYFMWCFIIQLMAICIWIVVAINNDLSKDGE